MALSSKADASCGLALSAIIFASHCAQATGVLLRLSTDIMNLRFESIDTAGQAALSRGYAIDIAAALSISVDDIQNLDGTKASVTVSARGSNTATPDNESSSALVAGKGDTHADLRPNPSIDLGTTTRMEGETTSPGTSQHPQPTTPLHTTSTSTSTSTTRTSTQTQTVTEQQVATTTGLPRWSASSTSPSTSATPCSVSSRPEVVDAPPPGSLPPVWPMRGVAYGALPCKGSECMQRGLPSQDMLQIGFKPQWGKPGRDDLGLMHTLGGNAVRMYHSFGLNTRHSHSEFLDQALVQGINVLPGYHTEMTSECEDFDCFDLWKDATLKGFSLGYQQGAGWHPAVSTLMLLNEPDFLAFNPKCVKTGAWCRARAAISALDGVIAAEKEAGVEPGAVNLTIAWSFAATRSIDGEVEGPGIFGFQDMIAIVANPQIVNYTPRTSHEELLEAYRTRWVNCLNTQAPWSFVKEVISKNYERFKPTPWFIGEYGANGQPRQVIEQDLRDMEATASEMNFFMGVVFFQFQTANQKGGSELNFGMFSLGAEKIVETGPVCDDGVNCLRWPVYCLDPNLSFLPGTLKDRAQAVAAAWGGSLGHRSLCQNSRRLSSTHATAQLNFYVKLPDGTVPTDVSSSLAAASFQEQVVRRTIFELGPNHSAILGALAVGDVVVEEEQAVAMQQEESSEKPDGSRTGLHWWGWLGIGAVAALLASATALVACYITQKRIHRRILREQSQASQSSV